MTINLQKGQRISLEKEAPGLKKIIVGLGWDVNTSGGSNFDLDASCFMLKDGKLQKAIYFADLKSPCGSVIHTGDNLTGAGEGDDEQIKVDLSKVPDNIDKLVFAVNIYQAKGRNQHFGMVNNAFVRIVDESTGKEVARYSLSESYPNMTAMVLAELYRHNSEWKMAALGVGSTANAISELAQEYR